MMQFQFEHQELQGQLGNMLTVNKSVHEQVVFDSSVERKFAEAREKNDAVKVYAKLPGGFKAPTPLRNCNPDCAALVKREGEAERLYVVVETKGSLFDDALRDTESAKIACGRQHFTSLAIAPDAAKFARVASVDDFSKHWQQG